jgi:hypothetical protein
MKKQYIKPTVEIHELKLKQLIMTSDKTVTIQTKTYEEAAAAAAEAGEDFIDL